MATFQHSISVGYSVTDTTAPGAGALSRSAFLGRQSDGNKQFEVTVPAGATNQAVAINFSHTNLKSVYLAVTDGAGAGTVTVKTNSSGSPDNTFTVKSNGPLVWNADMPLANPFTAAVTGGLYISNAGAKDVTVTGLVLEDV